MSLSVNEFHEMDFQNILLRDPKHGLCILCINYGCSASILTRERKKSLCVVFPLLVAIHEGNNNTKKVDETRDALTLCLF